MRAIRRFTVRPVLPAPLTALSDLAGNLRWSWHPETQDVFHEVDADLWESLGPRPGQAPRRGGARPARRARRRSGLPGAARRRPRRPDGVPDGGPVVAAHAQPARTRPPGDRRTSRRSSASPRCCRSTPAASGSWPATTSRPPATSACRSWASACSTATATSSSRSRARGGSRRPTPSWTPTSCRSRCCARPTAPGPRSRSSSRTDRTWWRGSGWPASGGFRC